MKIQWGTRNRGAKYMHKWDRDGLQICYISDTVQVRDIVFMKVDVLKQTIPLTISLRDPNHSILLLYFSLFPFLLFLFIFCISSL